MSSMHHCVRPLGIIALLSALAACAGESAATAESAGRGREGIAAPAEQHWLLVLHNDEEAGWQIRERVVVDAPLPHRRNPRRSIRPLLIELRDGAGQTVFSERLPDPSWVTAELVDPATRETTHARVRPPGGAALSVRVPALPGPMTLFMSLNGIPITGQRSGGLDVGDLASTGR